MTSTGGNLQPVKETMDSDTAFNATPLSASSDTSQIEDTTAKANPTFMQNQISIQRSPSNANSYVSALNRSQSVKSNGSSYDAGLTPSAAIVSSFAFGEELDRGRSRGDSDASSNEAKHSLKKTPSSATNRSQRSVRSSKSVRSVHGIGVMPFGTLRVHSPSPTRPPTAAIQECLKSGDVIVVRDIPAGSLFGCDMSAFTVREKHHFEGIKELPPGAHFIWGGSGETSARVGFWLMSSKKASEEYGEINVKRWDNGNETLCEEFSEAEMRIQREYIPEILNKLLPYDRLYQLNETPGNTSIKPELWIRLTSSMKNALLTKITGAEWNQWQVASSHDFKRPKDPTLENVTYTKDEVLNFVFPRDARTFSTTSTGRERTEQALDTSSFINTVISENCTYEDTDEIIGELQFCYITGMLLGNVACMEQWGTIVKVVFRAFRLILELPSFFRKFIQAVYSQFTCDEEGITGSILDNEPRLADDLKLILITFKARLNELLLGEGNNLTDDQNSVGKAFEEMESYLWKWGWDLRGNYVRAGKIQLDDGEVVDAELSEFEAEDERDQKKEKRRSRHGSSKITSSNRWF